MVASQPLTREDTGSVRLAQMLGVVVATPVFLSFQGGIGLAPQFSEQFSGSVLPISAFLLPIIALRLGLWRAKFEKNSLLSGSLVLLLVSYTLSLLVGYLGGANISNGSSFGPALLAYLQSCFCAVGALLAWRICSKRSDDITSSELAFRFVEAASTTVALFALMYLGQTFISGEYVSSFGRMADRVGPFYNFKGKRFFPVFVAVSTIFHFAFLLQSSGESTSSRFLRYGLFVGSLYAVSASWSRTGLLVVAAGILLILVSAVRSGRRSVVVRSSVLTLLGALAFMLVIGMAAGASAQSGDRNAGSFERALALTQNYGTGGLNDSDSRRFERMYAGIEFGLLRPFGDGFTQRDQTESTRRQIVVAESGYLDVAVRGGPVAVLATLLVPIAVLRRRRSMSSFSFDPKLRTALFVRPVFIAVVFVGMFFLNLATEPYFGLFFWALIGFVAHSVKEAKSSLGGHRVSSVSGSAGSRPLVV